MNSNVTEEKHSGRPSSTSYDQEFQAADSGKTWDAVVYGYNTYDSFIWDLQREKLLPMFSAMFADNPTLKYLDFACGTGRFLCAFEHMAGQAVGIDISADMLDVARTKVRRAELRQGDILQNTGLADFDYDVITAFRFFLNTEPVTRCAVMQSLARRINHINGRLVFNIHGNASSILRVKSVLATKNPSQMARYTGSVTMSLGETYDLVERSGMEVESWYGFGLCPRRLYSTPFRPLVRALDRWAAGVPALRRFSRDLLFVCRAKRPA